MSEKNKQTLKDEQLNKVSGGSGQPTSTNVKGNDWLFNPSQSFAFKVLEIESDGYFGHRHAVVPTMYTWTVCESYITFTIKFSELSDWTFCTVDPNQGNKITW